MLKHFQFDSDFLAHQAAAMPRQQLQANEERIGLGLQQAKAADGGAENGREIGVVRLVARIGGLSKLFGGEGVKNADLE